MTAVLAEHMAGSLHTGWWAGLVIGFAVVVVVVAVVAALLTYASRISDGAGEALDALDSARRGMEPLGRLEGASQTARVALAAARSARGTLER
ncbi:MAG: hypothetical protein LC790_07425, partial [Actinobacteria bacterium]|nr:hypothetical protein [Actinomycetota bacterium]